MCQFKARSHAFLLLGLFACISHANDGALPTCEQGLTPVHGETNTCAYDIRAYPHSALVGFVIDQNGETKSAVIVESTTKLVNRAALKLVSELRYPRREASCAHTVVIEVTNCEAVDDT